MNAAMSTAVIGASMDAALDQVEEACHEEGAGNQAGNNCGKGFGDDQVADGLPNGVNLMGNRGENIFRGISDCPARYRFNFGDAWHG